MRVYRRFRCEFGHEWTLQTSSGDPVPSDARCPEGHQAVTLSEEPPADEFQILIRPAARIVDPVSGQVWLSGRYYVLLLDRDDQTVRLSSEHYGWEDALKTAALFRGKPTAEALKWWERKRP